jgi:hypothetical protein
VLETSSVTRAAGRVIDSFFRSLGINPTRRQSRLFQIFRISGHSLVRNQALAMAKSEFPRPLTETIANVIQTALAARPDQQPDRAPALH